MCVCFVACDCFVVFVRALCWSCFVDWFVLLLLLVLVFWCFLFLLIGLVFLCLGGVGCSFCVIVRVACLCLVVFAFTLC